MAEIKVGDTIRYDGEESRNVDYLVGHEGVVVGFLGDALREAEIKWSEPLPNYGGPDGKKNDPVTWTQYLDVETLTLVKSAPYDQDAVNAIIRHLRERGYSAMAKTLEDEFAVPKTRTVSAEFQVPEGKSLTDYLTDIGIDYDITGGN